MIILPPYLAIFLDFVDFAYFFKYLTLSKFLCQKCSKMGFWKRHFWPQKVFFICHTGRGGGDQRLTPCLRVTEKPLGTQLVQKQAYSSPDEESEKTPCIDIKLDLAFNNVKDWYFFVLD